MVILIFKLGCVSDFCELWNEKHTISNVINKAFHLEVGNTISVKISAQHAQNKVSPTFLNYSSNRSQWHHACRGQWESSGEQSND